MKFALVQPNWDFSGSTYFGCPEPHFPYELLFARQQLQAAGHDVLLVDAHLENLSLSAAAERVRRFAPEVLVVTTAPSYLFWRCPQPELRIPAQWMRGLRGGALGVAIGPHPSATPEATLEKLNCDVALRGEPDHALARLVSEDWARIEGCCWRDTERTARFSAPASKSGVHLDARLAQTNMEELPALAFEDYPLELRQHRHHVFTGAGRGAELEFARGCPWSCNFCNKTLFRNKFRERKVEAVLQEAETLVREGFNYIYFIDEIFGCGKRTQALLDGLAELPLTIGCQTRIDLWDEETLERLGRAHCISMECGIESITPEGRDRFRKGCRMSTERIDELLRFARRHIPWVQANLIANDDDDLQAIEVWRKGLIEAGVWASKPVPVFAFPGSPLYAQLFGPPDDQAWERAHQHYLAINNERGYYSDIQSASPEPLQELESRPS